MNNLATEFREVCGLYIKLGEELTRIMALADSENPQTYVKSILQNRDCLTRITQMNSRVIQLSATWEKSQNDLDPKSQSETRQLVATARMQANRLQELCGIQILKLQTIRGALERDLAELGKGSQFMKSLKPVKNNYPKFIDSSY